LPKKKGLRQPFNGKLHSEENIAERVAKGRNGGFKVEWEESEPTIESRRYRRGTFSSRYRGGSGKSSWFGVRCRKMSRQWLNEATARKESQKKILQSLGK